MIASDNTKVITSTNYHQKEIKGRKHIKNSQKKKKSKEIIPEAVRVIAIMLKTVASKEAKKFSFPVRKAIS